MRRSQEYPVVMSNVWKRVNESGKNWRIVYKALTLLEYLIRNGSERAVEDARDHMYQLRTLCDFQFAVCCTRPRTRIPLPFLIARP